MRGGLVETSKNSSGKEFQNTLGDILTHVAIYNQHHRGQINFCLRGAGLEPYKQILLFFEDY
jgi:uncharacterized damage-inducible protein DinB